MKGFYPMDETDVLVTVKQARRPGGNCNAALRGSWHLMALPVGDTEFELAKP
jgi:hypothetical protein